MNHRLMIEQLESRKLLVASNIGVARFTDDNELLFLLNTDEDADIEIEYRFDVSRFARPDLELPASVFVTPVVGRWQGDGVYRPGVVEDGSQTFRWYLGDPNEVAPVLLNAPTSASSKPIVGDWDGDGIDDIGAVSNGRELDWAFRVGRSVHLAEFGSSFGFLPYAGDWDGNRTSNVGYVDNPSREWALVTDEVRSEEVGTTVERRQIQTFVPIQDPVVGDWNEDGKSDLGYVEDDGDGLRWNLLIDSDTTVDESFLFGAVGDIPLTGNWQAKPVQIVEFEGREIKNGDSPDPLIFSQGDATFRSALEISNPSDSLLILRDFVADGPFQLLTESPLFVPAGESASIDIEVDAQRAGTKSGSISWTHNASITDNRFQVKLEFRVGSVVHLAFDGYSISAEQLDQWSQDWSRSTFVLDPDNNGIDVEPFRQTDADREEVIDAVMELVQADFAPFNVLVERLGAGELVVADRGRTTVFVGNSTVPINRHIAGDIDVNNNNMVDLAFVGEERRQQKDRLAFATANAISHEIGHTVGLRHIPLTTDADGNVDLMAGILRTPDRLSDEGFLDVDAVLENGEIQNSFRYLTSIFGSSPILPVHESPRKQQGDSNGDGFVDFFDLIILAAEFEYDSDGATLESDFNEDGVVDVQDLEIMTEAFRFEPIVIPFEDCDACGPSPASISGSRYQAKIQKQRTAFVP